jgi:hypothetical protein
MANPEHLAILKQGVEVWNKWRNENDLTTPTPDLSGADPGEADLSHPKSPTRWIGTSA